MGGVSDSARRGRWGNKGLVFWGGVHEGCASIHTGKHECVESIELGSSGFTASGAGGADGGVTGGDGGHFDGAED